MRASLSFRVCVFFAANPDEVLSTSDICVKFGADPNGVRSQLRRSTADGWIATDSTGKARGKGVQLLWSGGPALLRTIGRTAP